ncbi:MAG: hypothetical protein Kow0099_17260 [Candidatus Abyssubacteria bacterium]
MLYIGLLVVSAMGTAALAVYLCVMSRIKPESRKLAVLMSAVAIWSLLYALELGSSDLSVKVFFAKLKYIGIVMVPNAWLVFALEYTGKGKWLKRRRKALLAVGPLATLAMVWTNDAHHLFWTSVSLDRSHGVRTLSLPMGIGFWLWAAYCFLLFFLGVLVILEAFMPSHRLYRRQATIMLVAAVVPWTGHIVYLAGLTPIPHMDLTPFAFTVTCLICVFGLLRFRILDIVPVARDSVIESMSDAVVVLDEEDRIVDLNPAAEGLFGCNASEAVGRPVSQLWPYWPGDPGCSHEQTESTYEIVLGQDSDTRIYEIHTSNQDRAMGSTGRRVVVLHDITEHRQAQQAVEASEANYRAIFNAANDAIFVHDIESGEILDVNQKMCEMYGYTPEEARKLTLEALSSGEPPYTEEDALSWMAKATRGEPQLFEWRAKDKDGRLFWVEVNLKRARIGGADRLLAIVRDITERKLTGEALREADRRYRLLAQNVTDIIWTVDLQTLRYTFVSPSVSRLIGYRASEVIGQPLMAALTPESFEVASKVLQEELSRDKNEPNGLSVSRTLALEQFRKDGSTVWTEVTVTFLRDSNNEPVELLGVTRDITERKRAEERLRRSEEKYRTLLDTLGIGFYETDLAGNLIFFNETLCKLIGYSAADLSGMNYQQFIDKKDRESIYRIYNTVFRTGQSAKGFVYEIVSKEGKQILHQASVTLVRDEEGKPVGFRGVARDITEEKKLEQQLLQAQKMESIGTLAGGIAHDFNNLLAGILGYASLTKAKISSDHQIFKYIDTIEKSATRAAELTAQLLAFARGGKYEVRVVELNSIVNETMTIISRTFEKSIEIEADLREPLPTLAVDTGQLQQVLMNLCVNARDAMPDGGKLTIKTDTAFLEEDSVRTCDGAKAGLYVTLSVTDTGVGMSEETMQRIFEPFFTTKPVGKGTGLGLAMVYGVVKNHGGHVCVHSEIGRGSKFTVYLPAQGEPATEEESPLHTIPQNGSGLILVVDDEESVRAVARDMLESYGYRVLLAEEGVKAIEVLKEKNGLIDVVILDMVMPKMGGYETFLKMKEVNPRVKVLLSTGHSKDENAMKILDSGVMAFLQKPYELHALLSKVRAVLDSELGSNL